MKLEEFTQEMAEILEAFRLYWAGRNASDPEVFPLEMEPGEWDEQFAIFTEIGEQ